MGNNQNDELSSASTTNFGEMGTNSSSQGEDVSSASEIDEQKDESSDSPEKITEGCKFPFKPIDETHCGHMLPPDSQENIQSKCSSLYDSSLPVPATFEENYSFSTFMPENNLTSYNELFWLGIKRDQSQDSWRTVDNENVEFTLWANEGVENCAIVNENSIPLWSTRNCSDLIAGLCILPRLKDKPENIESASDSHSTVMPCHATCSPLVNLNVDSDIKFEIHISSASSSQKLLFSVFFTFSTIYNL